MFESAKKGRAPSDPAFENGSTGTRRCDELLKGLGSIAQATTQPPPRAKPVPAQAPPQAKQGTAESPSDVKIELGRGAIVVRAAGIAEPPVPVFRDGKPLRIDPAGQPARFKIVEFYENASTTVTIP